MADIFISYSKRDKALATQLSAYLEACGYATWWDRSLEPGNLYRDEIAQELAAARVVIVIWTPHSIVSDFVRAEAGRAKADQKLLPTKSSDVTYATIPLPFGEMHTEDVGAHETIRLAVASILAKPRVRQGVLAWLLANAKYMGLSWLGIIGGAITLLSNWHGFIELADWCRVLVVNWKDLTAAFWRPVFQWFGVHLEPLEAAGLSLVVFVAMIAIGSRVRDGVGESDVFALSRQHIPALASGLFHWEIKLIAAIGAASICWLSVTANWGAPIVVLSFAVAAIAVLLIALPLYIVWCARAVLFLYYWPIFKNPRFALWKLVVTVEVLAITAIFIWPHLRMAPIRDPEKEILIWAMILGAGGSFVASMEMMGRRLAAVLILFAVVLLLNEVSKLGLHLRPPKL